MEGAHSEGGVKREGAYSEGGFKRGRVLFQRVVSRGCVCDNSEGSVRGGGGGGGGGGVLIQRMVLRGECSFKSSQTGISKGQCVSEMY